MKRGLIIGISQVFISTLASAQGGQPRQEWIECGLKIGTSPTLVAQQSAQVTNQQALLRGSFETISYVASVRGKTAVMKLDDSATGISTDARGAIELLRGGGRPRGLLNASDRLRDRGGDDDRDGQPENEGTFTLSLKNAAGQAAALVCTSKNQRI